MIPSNLRPFGGALPHSIKMYPVVQTAPEVGPQNAQQWPAPMRPEVQAWCESTAHHAQQNNIIYVHIPFCPFLCHFCPLFKVTSKQEQSLDAKTAFVNSLIREIQLYSSVSQLMEQRFNAIYFGGGTPSELSPDQLKQILDALKQHFLIEADAEITLEGVARQMGAPGYLEACYEAGFNRISFGVQSVDENIRKWIGRGDKIEDYLQLIDLSRQLQPDYPVNIDMMACLPGQTFELLEQDISTVLAWNLDSVDVLYYVLMPGTKMKKFVGEGRRDAPVYGQELLRARKFINRSFADAGYSAVTGEVFVKSEHDRFVENSFGSGGNRMNTLLALGPSAFGLIGGTVYQNIPDFKPYLEQVDKDLFPIVRAQNMTLAQAKRRALLLSTLQLEIPHFLVSSYKVRRIIKRWKKFELIEEGPSSWRFTPKGQVWYNMMQVELLPLSEKIGMLRMMGLERDGLHRAGSTIYEEELLKLAVPNDAAFSNLKQRAIKSLLKIQSVWPINRKQIGFLGPLD